MTTAIARRKSPAVSKFDQVAALFVAWNELQYDDYLAGHAVNGGLAAVAERKLSDHLRANHLGQWVDIGRAAIGVFETTEPGRVEWTESPDSPPVASISETILAVMPAR